MYSLLLAATLMTPTSVQLNSSSDICIEMEHELQQSVEFDIITDIQALDIVIRCLINYS